MRCHLHASFLPTAGAAWAYQGARSRYRTAAQQCRAPPTASFPAARAAPPPLTSRHRRDRRSRDYSRGCQSNGALPSPAVSSADHRPPHSVSHLDCASARPSPGFMQGRAFMAAMHRLGRLCRRRLLSPHDPRRSRCRWRVVGSHRHSPAGPPHTPAVTGVPSAAALAMCPGLPYPTAILNCASPPQPCPRPTPRAPATPAALAHPHRLLGPGLFSCRLRSCRPCVSGWHTLPPGTEEVA